MNALVKKEVRLLLPVWIAATVQAVLPAMLFWGLEMPAPAELIYPPFGLGVVLLGLTSFGHEFGIGTFSIMLAQPIPRLQLWKLKTRLLAASLFSVWLVAELSLIFFGALGGKFGNGFDGALVGSIVLALIAMAAFSSVLWTTLLLRQTTAAFWFTILIPSFISVFTWSSLEKKSEPLAFALVAGSLLVYSIGGFVWARWMFLRAQDAAWTGGTISPPAWLGFRTRRAASVPKLKPLRALLRKEIQSHHVTLLISALLFLSHLVSIVVRKLEYDPTSPHKATVEIFGFWWLLWFAVPMIIGATAVAEERKLGTLEGQLCLPARRTVQFAVKFLVTMLLGIFLGGVMPATGEALAEQFGVSGEFPAAKIPGFIEWLVACCSVAAGISLISFYASTLTRSLLQALGVSVLSSMVLTAFGTFIVQQGRFSTPLWSGPLGFYVGLPSLIAASLWLAFKNFKHVQIAFPVWCRNVLTVIGVMVLTVLATTLIWNRVWELALTLEPAHGPAQLAGRVRPNLLSWGGKIFALLPDGRMWVSTQFEFRATGELETVVMNGREQKQKIILPVPTNGIFLLESNWLRLASFQNQVVGIKADGSLWRVFQPSTNSYWSNLAALPRLKRIGTDSDWKDVAHGSSLIALKQDGSLWSWEPNSSEPVRIGHDTDWTNIFGSRQGNIAVKSDGSVWKWGFLYNPPLGHKGKWTREQPEPVRWYSTSHEWAKIDSNYNFDLLIKGDGTLWGLGFVPENFMGTRDNRARFANRDLTEPTQVGEDADFSDIQWDWSSLLVLKKTGSIYEHSFFERHFAFRSNVQKLSRNSDWLAIQHHDGNQCSMALAADGTLSAWQERTRTGYSDSRPLAPSRKPLWTLNILADQK